MRVDLERKRSPQYIARAIADYGEELTDPLVDQFSLLVANGHTATSAYQATHPSASRRTAEKQASILMAHPQMSDLIRGQVLGARGKLQAAAPRMADRLLQEALTADKDTKPRIDAINSALDRAGVPRMKEIAISVAADFSAAAAAFDSFGSGGTLEGEVVEEEPEEGPALLPAHPLEVEAYGDDDDADIAAAWGAVIPIEDLRHVDAAPDPADYDAAVAADADKQSDD